MSSEIAVCVCHHPLDYHDYKTAECLSKGCSCENFNDSGKRERIR